MMMIISILLKIQFQQQQLIKHWNQNKKKKTNKVKTHQEFEYLQLTSVVCSVAIEKINAHHAKLICLRFALSVWCIAWETSLDLLPWPFQVAINIEIPILNRFISLFFLALFLSIPFICLEIMCQFHVFIMNPAHL